LAEARNASALGSTLTGNRSPGRIARAPLAAAMRAQHISSNANSRSDIAMENIRLIGSSSSLLHMRSAISRHTRENAGP
jgi:hypothetical protein